MINFDCALDVLHKSDDTYTDYKKKAVDFLRDTFSFSMGTSDELYIGFYKPINAFYLDLSSINTATSGSMKVEYYKHSAWEEMVVFDETNNFTRSGFVTWERNLTNEGKSIVNNEEKYWYKVTTSGATSALTFNGINILFCDDQTLKSKFSKVLDTEFLDGAASHICVHVAVRDEIVEWVRRRGYEVKDINSFKSGYSKQVTPWDLLNIFEIREAAAYSALSKIFFDFSDNPADIWWEKSKKYEELYQLNLNNVPKLSVDINDDGVESPAENMSQVYGSYISR